MLLILQIGRFLLFCFSLPWTYIVNANQFNRLLLYGRVQPLVCRIESAPGVRVVLILGARREVVGSMWPVRVTALDIRCVLCLYPQLESALAEVCFVSPLASRFSRTHVCIVLSFCLRLF
jgi:hypothetical protein